VRSFINELSKVEEERAAAAAGGASTGPKLELTQFDIENASWNVTYGQLVNERTRCYIELSATGFKTPTQQRRIELLEVSPPSHVVFRVVDVPPGIPNIPSEPAAAAATVSSDPSAVESKAGVTYHEPVYGLFDGTR
jgi:hypothetical protein